MKLVVFGASGGTGKGLVTQGVAAGHDITAFVRNEVSVKGLGATAVMTGDALVYEDVLNAITDQDACVSALGARDLKTDDLLEHSIQNILRAMQEACVARLVVLGAAGALHDAGIYQSLSRRLMFRIIRATFLRHPFRDAAAQEMLIEKSSVNYTVVHPPRLTSCPATGDWREDMRGLPASGIQIARAEVAAFMLAVLDDPKYYRTGPYIAY